MSTSVQTVRRAEPPRLPPANRTPRRIDGAPTPRERLLLRILIAEMGGPSGPRPPVARLAQRLGVCHQRLYRMLRRLEELELLVRRPVSLEVRRL